MDRILRYALSLLVALACAVQPAVGQDSTAVSSRWIAATAAGAGMTIAGVAGRPTASQQAMPTDFKEKFGVADVAQYAPLALPWGIKVCGGATRSGWGRMAVSQGTAALLMCGGVYLTKHSVTEWRPDGSDKHSFPSGHAAWAFMGATMATRELAWRSPWYSVGAYTLASAIAIERVLDRRHYPADVAAGAGIGIIAGQVGYLIGDFIFRDRGLDRHYRPATPSVGCRSYLSVKTGMAFSVGKINLGGVTLTRLPGLYTGLDGGVALADHWLLTAEATITATPVEIKDVPTDGDVTGPRPLSEIGIAVMPGYCLTPSERVSLTARIGVGYCARASLKWPGDAVKSRGGSALGVIDLSAALAVTDRLSCSLDVGYRISRYSFSGDDAELFGTGARASGTDHRFTIGLSSRLSF